ncbi:putative Pentatricopeptide repeat-containing protein, chloroplastic [Cocos nucifera]|nr:putative Pentatricopeptide repeat-containing protein, chloroplastic [Cocos nucifera]
MTETDSFSWTAIISGHVQETRSSGFESRQSGMPRKDTLSWNATVGGFETLGHGREAIYPFDQMRKIGDTA